MHRNTWKSQEREYAKKIHGTRIPVTGRSGSDIPDITSHTIVGEVKKGAVCSKKTLKALEGIKEVGKYTHKYPILFQAHKEKGKRDVQHVVTLYLDDFLNIAKHLVLKNENHNKLLKSKPYQYEMG